ncbi:MAG TPA: NYN domain-containing protein [Aliidongia sp.]|nr:NYN domain-containing protein [Aliidongia sp.]
MADKLLKADHRAANAGAMRMLPNQKVVVLIDDNNLTICANGRHQRDIDYGKLLEPVGPREILRAILYRPATRERPFPSDLRDAVGQEFGIEVKTPPKNVDCWLTIDAVSLAAKADVVALVAGDGDYEPLVHYLKTQGCRVEVLSWGDKIAQRLREAADRYVQLDRSIVKPFSTVPV